jgi:hypothetical protein
MQPIYSLTASPAPEDQTRHFERTVATPVRLDRPESDGSRPTPSSDPGWQDSLGIGLSLVEAAARLAAISHRVWSLRQDVRLDLDQIEAAEARGPAHADRHSSASQRRWVTGR